MAEKIYSNVVYVNIVVKGKISIVEYPETVELEPNEAVYVEVKVGNEYDEIKNVRVELIDHEGNIRGNEKTVYPKTVALFSIYHPAVGYEGTFTWTLKATNLTDNKVEDSKTITVTVKKPEVEKYSIAVSWTGFTRPPYVSTLINVGKGDVRRELPLTVETTGWLRISDIRLYTRRTYEGTVWQFETGTHPKWIYSKSAYPPPEMEATKIVFEKYVLNLKYKNYEVTDTILTVLGITSSGTVTLRFAAKKYGYRQVPGVIVETNSQVKFKWTCPVCRHVNVNIEDKDRLIYLGWKVAEMCKTCNVQSYVILK